MDKIPDPTCPHCGFRIFNRRFPKCERCHMALPDTHVYSATERRAILHLEREEEERARKIQQDEKDVKEFFPTDFS